jgi:D-alanyl-D-alanine carboxypeptidase/D-alanyl-D-alanine-endopeptidase (penicillin-binding protein 4)
LEPRLQKVLRRPVTHVLAMLLAFPASDAAHAAKPKVPQTLEQRMKVFARVKPVRGRKDFAFSVARVGEATPLVSYNADTPLILASTTKLFTSAAALDRLGPDYRFRTRLFRDAEIGPDGVLPGHLVIVGGGDPALSGRLFDDDPLAVFRPWATSLAGRGLKKVEQGLLLDVSFFDGMKSHPDWPVEQEAKWYQAPISALSYNDNVVLVRASAGIRPGAPAILGFYPAGPPLLSLISRVSTARAGTWVGVRRDAGSSTVIAAGRVGRYRTWTGDVTVPEPALYFSAALSQVLRETGVEVAAPATLQTQPAAPSARRVLLHTHETPILPVLSVCNKRSQSFYAEQILKTLGAERRGQGSWANGLAEVSGFLSSLGLDPARYQLADGSGRSRNNRASAGAYLDFLQAMATRWDKFAAFETTLAVSGDEEGSLRSRLQGDATRGKVLAKTGNISGVVTLCGYVTAKSGQRYAFAILINGGITERRGHAWQDRFIAELAKFG